MFWKNLSVRKLSRECERSVSPQWSGGTVVSGQTAKRLLRPSEKLREMLMKTLPGRLSDKWNVESEMNAYRAERTMRRNPGV